MSGSHILIVIVAAIILAVLAERRRVQAPLLLTGVGMAASLIPGMPRTEIAPEAILGWVVAPLLYSAALDFTFSSFIRRLGSILNLGVVLVAVTAVAAATVAAWALPMLPLAMALALGAAVAPPDAVSAVAVGRRLKLPQRVMTVLKGESLINDAAALALFSGAVIAATGRANLFDSGVVYFLYTAVGGTILGIAAGVIVHAIRRRVESPSLLSALAIITPFATYAIAEDLHLSGVVAVVFAGFSMGRNAARLPFAGRIQEREVWRVADTLLEAFVFTYMGLQFRFVAEDAAANGQNLVSLLGVAGLVLATIVAVRIGWIAMASVLARVPRPRLRPVRSPPPDPLSWRENAVVSWAGMRGVVTLAAAAAMPAVSASGAPLEGRHAMILIAFTVAVGTLVLHSLTLPWLIRGLEVDDRHERDGLAAQRAHAHKAMAAAAAKALTGLRDDAELSAEDGKVVDLIRRRFRTSADLPTQIERDDHERGHAIAVEAIGAALEAQREALIAEARARRLDEEVMRDLLADIDLEQAALAARIERLS